MKKIMNKHILYRNILIGFLLFASFWASGQAYRKDKHITRSFKIDPATELKITNKYGHIELISWDKDSVKIEVKMEVQDKKEDKAMSSIKALDVDFVNSKYFVEAKTNLGNDASFWSNVKEKTGNIKTQVDYTIYLPPTIEIKIENKYGDIYLGDHLGKATITLSNGDLKAHALLGETTIDLEFAYANIKRLDNGTLNLSYHSEIQITDAVALVIDSQSSRVNIENVTKLDITSKRDKYRIENVRVIDGSYSYTYTEVQNLGGKISVKAKYGDFDIKNIENSVSTITFDVVNTDITLKQPPTRAMDLEVIYDERAGLYFPDNLKDKTTIEHDREEKLVKTTGWLGASATTPIHLKATVISGNIRIN